jgi:hypothetical protein
MIDCGCDEILLPQGSNGVDGKNAFTVTTVQFTQPLANNPVTITVSDTLQNTNQWAIPGQIIRITDSVLNGGWYRVTSIVGTNQIIAVNLDYQPGSSSSPTNILVGAKVSPAGLQGPAGTTGSTGADGQAGPPVALNTGTTQTLAPGAEAFGTVVGSGGNYTVNFGIPQGIPGKDGSGTLQWQYINNGNVDVPAGVTYFAIVPSSGFDSNGSLCPNNGDAFRATFWATAVSTASINARTIGGSFNIQLQLAAGAGTNQNIEYISNDTAYNNTVNMWAIPVLASNPTVLTTDPFTFFKFELIFQRITSTTAKYFLSWMSVDPSSRIPVSNCYSNNISFNFNTTDVKQIQVNALGSGGSSVRFSRRSLLIEKIMI